MKIDKFSFFFGLILGILSGIILLSAQKRHFQAYLGTIKGENKETIIRDTIIQFKPIEIEKRITDTISLKIHDTLFVNDTIRIYLPREQKIYQDTSYRAVVSGVFPSLDSIYVYADTKYIRNEVKIHPKWNVGFCAGYGVGILEKQLYLCPYIGVGLCYTLHSF